MTNLPRPSDDQSQLVINFVEITFIGIIAYVILSVINPLKTNILMLVIN